MPSIAEILAKKAAEKAAAANGQSAQNIADAASPIAATKAAKMTLAESAALQESIDRIDPPGKPDAATMPHRTLGIVVTKELPPGHKNGEPRGQATAITGPPSQEPERRALGTTAGELIEVMPTNADATTAMWETTRTSLEADLCVMRDPEEPEVCWLAIQSPGRPPLLLHRLPWLLYDHPATTRPANEPF